MKRYEREYHIMLLAKPWNKKLLLQNRITEIQNGIIEMNTHDSKNDIRETN